MEHKYETEFDCESDHKVSSSSIYTSLWNRVRKFHNIYTPALRFYVKSIFGILEIHNLVVLHFAFLRIFALCEDWNLPNWQISKPLKLYKKGSFTYNFYILQNWFHVISESWNFLTVSVRENFRNFHNVKHTLHSAVWKNEKFSLTIFFVKSTL